MKTTVRTVLMMSAAAVGLAAGAAWAHGEQPPEADQTLSPYFLVQGGDQAVEAFPLLATSAKVEIAGVIADVTVTQVYTNSGRKPIEAIYVFPASTRAAVYGMKMTIGERTIEARIQEREKARQEYDQARQEGKSASLLEQQRPNVFQMNVANIMPGDQVRVELRYTELLVPADGVYEFVYPTVVGPRYSNQKAAEAPETDRWIASPYLHEGDKPPCAFELGVTLNAGLPIQDMTCPTHKTAIRYQGPATGVLSLDPSETSGGNRDFILRFRLAGQAIESGLLLFEGERENFFLLMVQPPKRVALEAIPPREYIFIVDVSGSMHGFPLDISKELLRGLIGGLRPTDTFNVLLFSGGSALLSEKSLPATQENIQKAVEVMDRQRGGGGTELLPALRRALALPRGEHVSRTVVIATDGYVGCEAEAFDVIRENLGKANLFAFGIGSSVNRFLIEGLARAGAGEPFVLTRPEQAPAQAAKFRTYIQTPVLTGIQCEFRGFDAYDVEPPAIPDVLAERPVVVFGKYRGRADGEIRIQGRSGDEDYVHAAKPGEIRAAPANGALRYLWARARLATLGDSNGLQPSDRRTREITELGLAYNLLTAYTSFVAIDSRVRNQGGESETVRQPLPLPEGVSDYAVGKPGAVAKRAFIGGRPAAAACAAPMAAPPPPGKLGMGGGGPARERADKMEEREPASGWTARLTPPDKVAVGGRTILFFWSAREAGGSDHLAALAALAARQKDVTIYVVSQDAAGDQGRVLAMIQKAMSGQAQPANLHLVLDPAGVAAARHLAGSRVQVLPYAGFFRNGRLVQSGPAAGWNWAEDAAVARVWGSE